MYVEMPFSIVGAKLESQKCPYPNGKEKRELWMKAQGWQLNQFFREI